MKDPVPRVKDTESLLLAYNLLTTDLQKLLYLHLFYCKKTGTNLFTPASKTRLNQNKTENEFSPWLRARGSFKAFMR